MGASEDAYLLREQGAQEPLKSSRTLAGHVHGQATPATPRVYFLRHEKEAGGNSLEAGCENQEM